MTDAPILTAEEIRIRAEAFGNLVTDVVEGRLSPSDFLIKIREQGASSVEAEDYCKQLEQRLEQRRREKDDQGLRVDQDPVRDLRETTPEGLTDDDAAEFRSRREALLQTVHAQRESTRRNAVDTAAWAILQAKVAQLQAARHHEPRGSGFSAEDLAQFLGVDSTPSSSLPAAVLSIAPHLAELSATKTADSHLEETWNLRQVLSSDKTLDTLINLLQVQQLPDPIPRSIWRAIAQDQFVDFEKLFASMDRGYDHNDEPREFGGGYALVKKDQASARRLLKTESDWARVYTSWSAGVALIYRHRTSELQAYRESVQELFRAVPNDASVAIGFDVEVRDRYAKSPFRLDDRSRLNIPLLARMFRVPTSSSLGKRSSMSSSPSFSTSSKRASVPCLNWNAGRCEDPCQNRRKHGSCSECGGRHRAKDEAVCFTLLQSRRKTGVTGSGAEGGSSSGRT